MLITVDGVYSVGKSSLIERLCGQLERAAGEPVLVSEWNSSDLVGDLIPQWKRNGQLGPHSLLFVEAADVARRIEQVIGPALEQGRTVVADRYVLSAMARSVIRGVDPALAGHAFEFVPREDITILVEAPPELTLERRRRLGKHLGGYHSGRDYRRTSSVEADFVEYQREMASLYRTLAAGRGPVVAVNTEEPLDRCVDTAMAAIGQLKDRVS
jgi:dTMP kinase